MYIFVIHLPNRNGESMILRGAVVEYILKFISVSEFIFVAHTNTSNRNSVC